MKPMTLAMRTLLLALLAGLASLTAHADAEEPWPGYSLNPGDLVYVLVWNEERLSKEVLVGPDGQINMPLLGDVQAGGRTLPELERAIGEGLTRFMNEPPTVSVSLRQIGGNKIYVLGKVNRPGEFPINRPTDVMQALAMAGGLNPFAAENRIQVLRRDASGEQKAIPFRYRDVRRGRSLDSNILLQSGDVIVVP